MMLIPLALVLVGLGFAAASNDYHPVCKAIASGISDASKVYYPGEPLHTKGDAHFFSSSQQKSKCVVEPGTPEDVGKILKMIAAAKAPFAVKSGGHTTNPGFSSTQGIQIYMGKFSQVTYDAASSTAVIGSGLIWDTVYERLQEHNVVVVGGRVTGIGVGGFALGGGYSFKTNQFGLCIDTIVGFNLVLPNGTVAYVTQSTHPDLFFGLKGGFNNFGIVTDFTMTAFPQSEVWGGSVIYPSATFNQVRTATADFSAYSQDPKAAIISSYVSAAGAQIANVLLFYDGPTPPPGTFDNFTKIPSVSSDLKTRSYLDLILSAPANSTAGLRGSWEMVAVSHFTENFLKEVESELTYWTTRLNPKGIFFAYSIEPFLQSHLSHANSPSAWPDASARQPGKAPNPIVIFFGWQNPSDDDALVAAVEHAANRLAAVAQREGLVTHHPPALYGNYMNAKTSLVMIYGDNLPRLRALKAEIDPQNVMDLTGGFKF